MLKLLTTTTATKTTGLLISQGFDGMVLSRHTLLPEVPPETELLYFIVTFLLLHPCLQILRASSSRCSGALHGLQQQYNDSLSQFLRSTCSLKKTCSRYLK